jgi:uncharacterized protein (TIGR02246 family)
LAIGVIFIVGSTGHPVISPQDAKTSPAKSAQAKTIPANKSNQNAAIEAAVKKLAQQFAADFNKNDAKAVAAHWTEDGDYVNENGQKYLGRDAIEKEYASFFKDFPGVKMEIVVDSVRLINATTIIEDGRASIKPLPQGSPASSRYTAIHVKQGDKWLMKSVRDSRIEKSSNHSRLSDFEWLIGTWTAEHEDVKVSMTFAWQANKNCIVRNFETTKKGQPVSAGMQVIGWDPQQEAITSRLFDHNGGHAIGLWSPIEEGWAVETLGHSVNAVSSGATNVLARVDDDTLSWRSVDRVFDGQSVADTEEIILNRK